MYTADQDNGSQGPTRAQLDHSQKPRNQIPEDAPADGDMFSANTTAQARGVSSCSQELLSFRAPRMLLQASEA